MVEFKGWISILNATDGEEQSDMLESTIVQIRTLLEPLKGFNQFFDLQALNGTYTLWIGGDHNHDSGYSDSLLALLNQISKIARGSYGVVYLRWPEDRISYNEFKIYRIAKGKVSIEEDKLLSPCTPIIED